MGKTHVCYPEKAPNAWNRQGTHKTGNTQVQHKRPLIGTTHRPSTSHHRKGPMCTKNFFGLGMQLPLLCMAIL